jgi:hypothetical protein
MSGDHSRYKGAQRPSWKGIEAMKSVPLAPVLVALLAFTTSINAQEKSQEQAVRQGIVALAEAINPRISPAKIVGHFNVQKKYLTEILYVVQIVP